MFESNLECYFMARERGEAISREVSHYKSADSRGNKKKTHRGGRLLVLASLILRSVGKGI